MPSSRKKYERVPTGTSFTSHESLLLRSTSIDHDDDDDGDDLFTDDFLDDDIPYSKKSLFPDNGRRYAKQRRWNPCRRLSRTCVVVSILTFCSIITLTAFGGLYVYRHVPLDGLSPPWYPTPQGGGLASWQTSYEKARAMVGRMSLAEKVNITTGTGWSMNLCVGNTGPAINAGFPPLCYQDGPLGIRFSDHSSAFPAGVTVGATWNRELMRLRGASHGQEARGKGVNVLLGPAMGPLGRNPAGGRVWEGFGSDPVLQGVAAFETIRGIQSQGVIATAKHFIGNEQEHYRRGLEWGLPHALSSNIDDRTLHEIYAWPFAQSVRAGVGSVMCSYQMVNNSYACGNSKLMNGILKDELGFQGFVQSDWLAQRGGVSTALAGLDVTMHGDGLLWMDGKSLWGKQLTISVLNGSLPMERLDDMATRVVAAWYQMDQDTWDVDGPNFSSWTNEKMGHLHEASPDDTEQVIVNHFKNVQSNHSNVAQMVAAEGIVLVKNEGNILPLKRSGGSKGTGKYRVAIIGEDAGPGDGPNTCPDRGCNQGTLAVGWGSGATEFPHLLDPSSSITQAFHKDVQVDHNLHNVVANSPNELEAQDLCIVFASSDSGEGYIAWNGIQGDRNDLYLDKGGDTLIKSVAQNCGKGKGETIVVIHAVGPVSVEDWFDLPGVKGVLLAHLPGQESGAALVDVMFGNVDASGRLPYTLGKSLDDYGPGAQVMYYPKALVPQVNFDEGLYVDYRYFDKNGIQPRFEFGFGMSYTTFEFSELSVNSLQPKSPLPAPRPAGLQPPLYDSLIPEPSSALYPADFRRLKKYIYPWIDSIQEVGKGSYPYPVGYDTRQNASAAGGGEGGNPDLFTPHVSVSVRIKNTGTRTGKEVVQLYLSFPDGVREAGVAEPIDFPPRVLRNFEKVLLDSEESTVVQMNLTRKDLSYWSVLQQNWVMPNGDFKIWVGRSSRDLPLTGSY